MKNIIKALTCAVVCCVAIGLAAQTPAPGFSSQAGPLAIQYNGEWSVGSFVAERYDILDFGATKANHLHVNGVQLLAPTPGINMYMGGFDVEPDLSALTKKLNMPPGNFSVFLNGEVGSGTVSIGTNGIAWAAGGGVAYKLTNDLSWQPLIVNYGRFGANQFLGMSTQLSFVFGKKQ